MGAGLGERLILCIYMSFSDLGSVETVVLGLWEFACHGGAVYNIHPVALSSSRINLAIHCERSGVMRLRMAPTLIAAYEPAVISKGMPIPLTPSATRLSVGA